MANQKNPEKAVTAATTSTQKEAKSSAENKKLQAFIEVLRQCGTYEADAIRSLVDLSEGTELGEVEQMNLYRFLNLGAYKENCKSAQDVMVHRQARACELMNSVVRFITSEKISPVMAYLMKVACDGKVASDVFRILTPMPARQANRKDNATPVDNTTTEQATSANPAVASNAASGKEGATGK